MSPVDLSETPPAALVRKTLGIYDAHEYDRLDEVLHEDVQLTFLGQTSTGIGPVREMLEALYAAIPDQTHAIERMTVDEPNEAVAIEMLVSGTFNGEPFPTAFGPVPSHGRYVEWRPGSFIRARDGKVASWTVYLDQVTVLNQLGAQIDVSVPAAR